MAFRLISLILSLSMFCQQAGVAYASGELNLANYLSQARSAIVQPDRFQPPRLRYISYDINNNDFKLLLDKGNIVGNGLEPFPTQQEEAKLFNYFLIGLALPNDTFWVNLRPDAPENIIDPLLEKTDIGKIFLEADLQLKKDTASLTSPQNPEGKAYWNKLYKKAGELFGSENITIPTITRPWIVPNEVIVRETEDSAYIYKATLKVMLEADYLQNQKTEKPKNQKTEEYGFSDPRLKELNEYSSRIIRETIIPRLTREVNSSKRYAKLRQVYYSLVLARWFKQKYSSLGSAGASERPSTTLGASQSRSPSANSYLSLIDSGNLANLASPEPCDKQVYFQAYQKSFKDGEYNLKETVASPYGQSIRNYISGGINTRMQLSKVYVGANSKKVTDVLKNVGMLSGSPIEIAFWDGETRKKGTLTYVRGNELGKGRREKILNNKPFFMEDKTQSNLDVIEAIEGRNGELLSNIRFAFSESDILEGYIVISKEGNSIAAINAVAGVTQWIETALIIAVIQELADSSPPVYSVKLNNVLRDNPYHRIILRRLSGDNKNPFYDSLHMNQQGEGSAAVYPDDIKRLIKGYYDNILEEVKNENENHQIINKFSISSLTPKESVGNGQMSIAGLTVGGVISRAKKEMEVFFSSLEDWLIPQGLNIDQKQMIVDAFAELDKAKSVSETLKKIETLIIKLNNIKKSYIESLDLDPDSPDKDELSRNYTFMVLSLRILLNQAGWGALDANLPEVQNGDSTASPLTAHILSYEERSKIIEIKKELSVFTVEVGQLLNAYPDLLKEGYCREVVNKIKEFGGQNDILSLAGIMKEFYGAASKYTQKSGGNAISDKIKEWAEVQDIVNKAIEEINKSIDEDIESDDNKLTEVPPGYGGEKKDYYDDVKMLLKKKDFAGVASWMIQWWLWQNNDIKVRKWWGISEELKIINMRSGLPHYFANAALKSGGIDLTDRFMRLNIERVGSFAYLKLVLPRVQNVQGLDLDKEFRQIEAIASSGIVPNSRRILELFSACYSRGEFGQRLPQVISCLKASSAIQEKLAIDSDDDFRMCLLLPEVFSDGS